MHHIIKIILSVQLDIGSLAHAVCDHGFFCYLIQKRHAAQMTRLQRQATDAQSQRRQWVEEIIRINRIIQNIKSRIEE